MHQIETRLHERQGAAPTNFKQALPAPQSELAQQLTKDPYIFDFMIERPVLRIVSVAAACDLAVGRQCLMRPLIPMEPSMNARPKPFYVPGPVSDDWEAVKVREMA